MGQRLSLAGWPRGFRADTPPGAARPKNKSQKVGVFFRAEKLTAKTPRLPRKSPHSHQQKTTSKPRFLPKTLCKNTDPPQNKKNPEKSIAPDELLRPQEPELPRREARYVRSRRPGQAGRGSGVAPWRGVPAGDYESEWRGRSRGASRR